MDPFPKPVQPVQYSLAKRPVASNKLPYTFFISEQMLFNVLSDKLLIYTSIIKINSITCIYLALVLSQGVQVTLVPP